MQVLQILFLYDILPVDLSENDILPILVLVYFLSQELTHVVKNTKKTKHTTSKSLHKLQIIPFASSASPGQQQVFSILECLLLLCPFLCGGFFPWGSALISLVLISLLFLLARRGLLCRTYSAPFLAAVSIVLFHLGGIIWGTDHGMALVGAVQFLPLPLFVLLIEQYAPDQRMALLKKMPYTAAVMVILSFLLSLLPSLANWFLVAGRQAGFFQYPNTYAIYLLLALVLVLYDTPPRFGKLPWMAVLLFGIILSGSRTVFFLLLAVLLVFFLTDKSKQSRLSVLSLATLLLFGSVLYVFLTGNRGSIGRFLTASLTSSELVGRLLYAQDAIPVILRHPLGLGYAGYRSLQGSFQTGVYSVQHVHNELFQLLLDVGWIPAALFLWALLRSLCSREGGLCRKLLLAVLLLHCLLDFDTQFVSVALLLFLVLDAEPQAQKKLPRAGIVRHLTSGVLVVLVLLSLWIGCASFLYYFRKPAQALKVYPAYTSALVDLLPRASDQELGPLADRVLRLNRSVALAHDAKAKADYLSGDFSEAFHHKQEAIRLSRYSLTEYLDYFDILQYTRELYLQRGDQDSADRCLSLIAEIPGMLEAVDAQTSRLGHLIKDQPALELPERYRIWLAAKLTNDT